jgi:GNAT superfamily N-acetyltransferase
MLGSGDEEILALLAAEEADFDLADRSEAAVRLPSPDAAAYLADPGVLHWVAEQRGRVVGFNLCYVLRRRSDAARELLLFEIGVREESRRSGVGAALIGAMRAWMEAERVPECWVLADNPGAQRFYAACGFARDDEQGVQMLLTLPPAT